MTKDIQIAKLPTMKELRAAAMELNALLKPCPPIRFIGVRAIPLIEVLRVAASLLEPEDEITRATADLLNALGIEICSHVIDPQKEREKSEAEFNAWLDSIEFVDEHGYVIPAKLFPDESDDPERDREG